MTNILFIAYEFPPLNRAGIFRPMYFVKYLQQFNINPIVFTLGKNSIKNVYGNAEVDESLGAEVVKGKTIVEVESGLINSKDKSKIKNFLDIYFSGAGQEAKGWKKDFTAKFIDAVHRYKPRLVFITVPPFSNLQLVIDLAKKFGLPVIGDFRDAWSQWIINPYASYFHYKYIFNSERKVLKGLDAVTVTSLQTLDDLKKIHPSVPASKYHYLPNGYEGDLQTWSPLEPKEQYTIGYVGSFYYSPGARENMFKPWWKKKGHKMLQFSPHREDWKYRSPYFFFKALQALFENYPEYRQVIKVKFAGGIPEWLPAMIAETGLENNVELFGFLPHSEVANFQNGCDALLVTSSKRVDGRDYSIASKTFEYFQVQKPIIAFVCDGAQKDILAGSGIALLCDPDDVAESARKLRAFFAGKIDLYPSETFVNRFKRKNLTEQLSKIIFDLINSSSEKNIAHSRHKAQLH